MCVDACVSVYVMHVCPSVCACESMLMCVHTCIHVCVCSVHVCTLICEH